MSQNARRLDQGGIEAAQVGLELQALAAHLQGPDPSNGLGHHLGVLARRHFVLADEVHLFTGSNLSEL